MEILQYSDPYNHFEVKNFLSPDDFKKVKECADSFLPKFKDKYQNRAVLGDSEENYRYLNDALPGDIKQIALDNLNYLCNQLGIVIQSSHYITISIDYIQPGWEYNRIHTDSATKYVMTLVVALSDTGTMFHLFKTNQRNSYAKTPKWTPNCGAGFLRTDDTWHDFDSIYNTEIRKTLHICIRQRL